MRLRKLYSNRPDIFGPIEFRRGLNVVLGEIRLPHNQSRSTHNLGKTTLARIIDFCLCRQKDASFFLFKHREIFEGFIFFLEVETLEDGYVTVRRSVASASKLSFVKHEKPGVDFSDDTTSWDHEDLTFEAGKQLFDGLLGLTAIKPWGFRMPVGYALRTQNDFGDVFQLSKYRGKHREWKPYVAHILGFDDKIVKSSFDLTEAAERLKQEIALKRAELGAADIDLDKIRGLIEIKKKDVNRCQSAVQEFDLAIEDSAVNTDLVERLDEEIAHLNNRRYLLSRTQKRLRDSLSAERIAFSPKAMKLLFAEAGVVFPDGVVKEFDDLVRFNKEISKERIEYLKEELAEVNDDLGSVAARLAELNGQRQAELDFLGDTESVSKYREMNDRLVMMKNDLASLERQRDAILGIEKREKEQRKIIRQGEENTELLRSNINECGEDETGRYSHIRSSVSTLCERFIGHPALLTTKVNKAGNIEFHAEYTNLEDQPTSEDEGKSYMQVLCAAYDLAVIQVLLDTGFLRFVFHDGLLEGLDDRVKMNIIGALRDLSSRGIQQILTVIDSDLPLCPDGSRFTFDESEVMLVLHDEGPEGRLFRMKTW